MPGVQKSGKSTKPRSCLVPLLCPKVGPPRSPFQETKSSWPCVSEYPIGSQTYGFLKIHLKKTRLYHYQFERSYLTISQYRISKNTVSKYDNEANCQTWDAGLNAKTWDISDIHFKLFNFLYWTYTFDSNSTLAASSINMAPLSSLKLLLWEAFSGAPWQLDVPYSLLSGHW